MELNFQFAYSEETSRRKSFRTNFAGLRVIILGESFEVHDLSASGLSFTITEELHIFQGCRYPAHLIIASRIYIADIALQPIRIPQDLRVACCFVDITPRQEIQLDKLILEMQKPSITHLR